MKRLALIAMLPIYAKANAPLNSIWNACRKSEGIEICESVVKTVKSIEQKVERKLEILGIKSLTVATLSTAHAISRREIDIQTGKWDFIGCNRSVIKINGEEVFLKLEWGF